jgi:uncharacterized NAD(P)/FAD-binding protein YdhS/predicted metal-dependent enzyme (double-stranded beta helix superfamily)
MLLGNPPLSRLPGLAPTLSLPTRRTTAPLSEALEALFASLDRCPGVPTLADLDRCLVSAELDLADILPHASSDRKAYVRTLVRRNERYESFVMCWMPGQKSPVHDHGSAACGVRVIQGSATETLYTVGRDGLADPLRRRVYHAGDVLSARDADIHSLGNVSLSVRGALRKPVALVTLHVYAPRLENIRKYMERTASSSSGPRRRAERATVAVVGGGAAGTLTAIHLARASLETRIVLVERAPHFARGVAFSTMSSAHRLNVPAARMSAVASDPEHFLRWVRARIGSKATPDAFLPRRLYGDYLADLLDGGGGGGRRARIERVRGSVVDLVDGDEPRLELSDGTSIRADRVVLALGNAPPRDPPVREGASFYESPRYSASPWTEGALDDVALDTDVLLVGTGLTMYDVALTLHRRGHTGTIHAFSRHGLRPRAHGRRPLDLPRGPSADHWLSLPPTARALLRAMRIVCKGMDGEWRSVVDSLRGVTPLLWSRMSERERARFMTRLRPYWDVHRHRAPAEVDAEIRSLIEKGSLRLHAGRLHTWREDPTGVTAVFDRQELHVGHVVNCTGPDGDIQRSSDPLVRSLISRGLVVRDPLGLGVETTDEGALVDAMGRPSSRLYTLGGWRRPALWESTAIPELSVQAERLAEKLAREATQRRRYRVASDDGPALVGT